MFCAPEYAVFRLVLFRIGLRGFCLLPNPAINFLPLLGTLWIGIVHSFIFIEIIYPAVSAAGRFIVCHSGPDPESSDFCLIGCFHTDHANKD